jgi:hypothetical protein
MVESEPHSLRVPYTTSEPMSMTFHDSRVSRWDVGLEAAMAKADYFM